jgi:RNA polymerase sigma-70 factor (ECF subfamily)
LKAWLMTILRNHYINGLRRTRIEVETIGDIPEGALPSAPNQEHVVEVNEVANALQRMSVEHREILVLVSAAGLSYEEAAEVCGCAVGTIKSRLNRARGELKKVLAKSRGLAGEGRRDGTNPPGTNSLPRAI